VGDETVNGISHNKDSFEGRVVTGAREGGVRRGRKSFIQLERKRGRDERRPFQFSWNPWKESVGHGAISVDVS
jgi:hypothetical protein